MSSFTDDDLMWVQVYPVKDNGEWINRGVKVLGVFTNSVNDQALLKKKLHECFTDGDDGETHVNDCLEAGVQYVCANDQIAIANFHEKNLFYMQFTKETNPEVAKILRGLAGSTEVTLYTVRRRSGDHDKWTQENMAKATWEMEKILEEKMFKRHAQTGGRALFIGDLIETFSDKAAAVEKAAKRTEVEPGSTDQHQEPIDRAGVIVAGRATGDNILKYMYWVTKVVVSAEERKDDYTLKLKD